MYSDKELIALVQFAQKHVQGRFNQWVCPKTDESCEEDGHEECLAVKRQKISRKVKMTYRPKLLRKILLTHYQGVTAVPNPKTGALVLSGNTLQYAFNAQLGGTVYRTDNEEVKAICEGEGEPDSFIRHQVLNCRSAEDFYGSLAQFINKWDI